MSELTEIEKVHPLATKSGLELFVALLVHSGAMCPKCGFGTRATSKKWARCKRCNERVERRPLPEPLPAQARTYAADAQRNGKTEETP